MGDVCAVRVEAGRGQVGGEGCERSQVRLQVGEVVFEEARYLVLRGVGSGHGHFGFGELCGWRLREMGRTNMRVV